MGSGWRGYQDIDPGQLTRERMLEIVDSIRPEMLLAVVRHGTPSRIARDLKGYVDAGLRVATFLDYGTMAGVSWAAGSAARRRAVEDEALRLYADVS